MKAIGFKTSLPITAADSFIEFEAPKPIPAGHELLVKIEAISVNPVDYKIRQNAAKDTVLDTPKIIGWDASGIVEAVIAGAKLHAAVIAESILYDVVVVSRIGHAPYDKLLAASRYRGVLRA